METSKSNIKTHVENAAKIIAPLWPMQTIIARNPLQGLESLNFEVAIELGQKFLANDWDRMEGVNEVNREMIKWCQAFLDEGQATIVMPEREKGFYRAWSQLAPFDDKLRSSKNNSWLFSLPLDPEEALIFCLDKLNIHENESEEYFKYLLAELPGWAGYIKWRAEWQNKEDGLKNPITLIDFLAVRLVITCALENNFQKITATKDVRSSQLFENDFFIELRKKEEKYLLNLLEQITPHATNLNRASESSSRPDVQIVFCIDVRSEPFRKRIELEGNYETFGFAGFFGLPVSIHNYNTDQVKDCCPVLLKPIHKVFEEPIAEFKARLSHHQKGKSLLNIFDQFYEDLKYNFGTPYALVETLGIWCGFLMAIRTLMPRSSVKLKKAIQETIMPTIATTPKVEIPLVNQINYGESALRMMGLTDNFSPLVILCGHGSQTENNPYASALDCGACGGNHGGPNGKILSVILNSPDVRAVLKEKGISIPEDTLFMGAEHNTTTDEVVIEDCIPLDNTHKEILEQFRADLVKAGIANNQYRCNNFGLNASPDNSHRHVLKRSSDWAEVRPEWGLARNAAFIVGPRSLTKQLNLDGRCFLHSYEWRKDGDGKFLETILTAPMVVAEWINTQYFFSTLNNIAYGSGSKITHNITGKFGVMQGNSSDLMQGLPLQSVNINDDNYYHDPIRLQVIVYAPRTRIESLVEKHQILKNLVYNNWVVLTAIDPLDCKSYRLTGKTQWESH